MEAGYIKKVCMCVCVCVRLYAVSTGETGTTTHRQLWKHSQPWISPVGYRRYLSC